MEISLKDENMGKQKSMGEFLQKLHLFHPWSTDRLERIAKKFIAEHERRKRLKQKKVKHGK